MGVHGCSWVFGGQDVVVARYVIVGAGLAGVKAAEALRDRDRSARIVLIGDEGSIPYERPPLSKDYLTGTADRESAFVHAFDWYAQNRIELRTGIGVIAVDRGAKQVELADGSRIYYDKLLLATGSRARTLPQVRGRGVHVLRRIDDADRIKALLETGGRLVVIGGGWIGLEVAAAARQVGLQVTVVEAGAMPLQRTLGPEVAPVFTDLHRANGVDLRLGTQVLGLTAVDRRVTGVELAGGEVVAADHVLVAIGAEPNVALAVDAGLAVDDGVLVDRSLRTDDPDIYAVGDIARQEHPVLGQRIRVEHWAAALHQPAVAAAGMTGAEAEYRDLPYFFTDQYDLGMEFVGYVEPGGYDEVVFRGEVVTREFIAFWLREGRVLAGMDVNVRDVDEVRALILSGEAVDPRRLADVTVPLSGVSGP